MYHLNMTKTVFALLKKDLLLELRQQHSFYGILLYVASTIFVLYLSLNNPEADVWNALFWVIQLFVCVNAVAKSFLQESRGRMLYFYSIASAKEFIVAKLIYNIILMLLPIRKRLPIVLIPYRLKIQTYWARASTARISH